MPSSTQNPTETTTQETQSKEVQTIPEIITVEQLENLPDGICLTMEDGEGTDALNQVISNIMWENEKRNPDRTPPFLMEKVIKTKNYPQRLIGEIFKEPSGYRRVVIDQILEKYPNICWLRGTTYNENANGVPIPSAYTSMGANGYMGDIGAVGYAESNYSGKSHAQSVLFITSLKKLMEGVDSGAVKLGTEHDYDVTVKGTDKYDEWALKNWVICDLGNSPEDLEQAKEILTKKTITI